QREGATQLITAADKASNRARHLAREGRPKGTGGNPTFDWFVSILHEITQEAGGKLTHYRDRTAPDPEFRGSLRPVIDALRPHLPCEGFFPTGTDLDFALERLRDATTLTSQKPT